MKRLVTILAAAALLLAALCAGAVAPTRAAATTNAPDLTTTFSPGDWGSFAEGMAADDHGSLFVSLTTWGYADETTADSNTGELWRITPGGHKELAASMDLSPYGMLLGVAADRRGRIYVACYDMGTGLVGNGVYRLGEDGGLAQVVALPEGAWANGLAFHQGRLYITDSAGGSVWRVRLGDGVATPRRPWSDEAQLKPAGPGGIGANGIAFLGDDLYVSVADHGRVVRIPVRADGTAGAARRVCQNAALKSADGIAFDAFGRLWITVNAGTTGAAPSGALYRLTPAGRLTTIADDPGWLDYPTQPVFGTTLRTAGTLYVENGAFYSAYGDGTAPDVRALRAGIPGLPLR
jgi:sugar lactone lactonase YvrE